MIHVNVNVNPTAQAGYPQSPEALLWMGEGSFLGLTAPTKKGLGVGDPDVTSIRSGLPAMKRE